MIEMNETRGKILLGDIHKARSLYVEHGGAVSHDRALGALLTRYGDAIRKTKESMQRLGIFTACTSCVEDGRGSCCFPGIEEGYDWVLLLANLLLGCNIPEFHEIQGSCFFVGERGCKLFARYYFCIHYLCPGIRESTSPSDCEGLYRIIGEELSAGWELESTLRRWIERSGTDPSA